MHYSFLHQHNRFIKKSLQQFNQVTTIMGVYIKYNMLVTVTEPKTFCFDLPKQFDKNLKHEIDFIIKYNEILSNHTVIDKII